MKPQSLQDAIKAKALKKEQARQSEGWKEPYVKKYEITAADLVKTPAQPAAVAASPVYAASPPPALHSSELSAIRKVMEELQIEVKQQRMDLSALQQENKELRDHVDKLQVEQAKLAQNNNIQSASQSSTTQPAVVEPSSPKKVKPPASPAPHTIEDLAESQRLDKAMRHFMRTQEGLYDAKYMTIREEADGRIICFKNKIYMPVNLREKTIGYYKSQHATESEALAAMRKNCCWPDLEKDFFAHAQ